MISETRRWIRDNASWLGRDHAPMVQQLKMLAETMDMELRTNGRVQSATASAHRHAFTTLLGMKPEDDELPPVPAPTQPEAPAQDEDDDLFEPAR